MSHLQPVARLASVSTCYGETLALGDVSLGIAPGGVIALLGPNGAGKTTTIKLLLGLASPSDRRAIQGSMALAWAYQ